MMGEKRLVLDCALDELMIAAERYNMTGSEPDRVAWVTARARLVGLISLTVDFGPPPSWYAPQREPRRHAPDGKFVKEGS
jgi:hypothetical protein